MLDKVVATKMGDSIVIGSTYFVQVLYYNELRRVGLNKVQAN